VSNENLSLFPDFQQRLSLLALLGYVDNEKETVTIKGKNYPNSNPNSNPNTNPNSNPDTNPKSNLKLRPKYKTLS
jgi:hypothetical protein